MDRYSRELGVIAQSLIATHSIEHVGSKAKYLNVVRDVLNVIPIVWIADSIVRRNLPQCACLVLLTGRVDRTAFEDGDEREGNIPATGARGLVPECFEVRLSSRCYMFIDRTLTPDSYVYDEVPASEAIEMQERASRTADLLIKYTKEHLSEEDGTSVRSLFLPGIGLLTHTARAGS